ncbi:globin domain-containing protein [Streptomyces naganishii]|uniref:Flavohemoprotein n=1 Tax=Streptomyces naganishii JCM 4654 TaxID=1306179 RepID=A0A918Y7I5_9ACTN|nr:globin domain-containing protein [Streptomyces naganishii]GHD91794.1 flavohemoprotein [Streptomyces naganishii JCM 4654]
MALETALVTRSFAAVEPYGIDVAAYFYDHLLTRNPELRSLFAAHLDEQRDRLWAALRTLVANLEKPQNLQSILEGLGRRHASYGALPEHYPAVGASLLATLEHFAGDSWDSATARAWSALFGVVSATMTGAAAGTSEGGSASAATVA